MKTISTDKAPAAIGPYSQAKITGNLLFASGQIPVDPATGEIPAGIEAQTEQVCKNIGELLKAAGSSYDNVVKSDFKKHGGEQRSQFLSREYGLYRQDYCGCEFSLRSRQSATEKTN